MKNKIVQSKVTVLEGYYETGDYECFCFDKCNGPSAHSHKVEKDMRIGKDVDPYEAWYSCRVYPDELIPDGAIGGYGKWTITVEFEPMKEPPH